MFRLFRWLFTGDGHMHIWEEFEYSDVIHPGKGVIRKVWIQKCKHCGALKEFRSNV